MQSNANSVYEGHVSGQAGPAAGPAASGTDPADRHHSCGFHKLGPLLCSWKLLGHLSLHPNSIVSPKLQKYLE